MTDTQARVAQQAFERTLAACGVPPSLFVDADGTAQREAVRRWHLGTVIPLADSYPLDLAGRAQAFQKLVAGGMDIDRALAVSGLMTDG